MSWWPWSENASEATASKSNLRDARNRLRSILRRCGLEDEENKEEVQSTGDPFQDRVNHFTRSVKQCSADIIERNQHQRERLGTAGDLAAESQEINRELLRLKKELDGINEMLTASGEKLRKKEEKEKDVDENAKSDMLKSLRRVQVERMTSTKSCETALQALRDLNLQRNMSEEEAKREGAGGGAGPKTFRTSIEMLKDRRRANAAAYAVDDGQSTDLAKNEETAEEMRILKEQQKQQDEALGQLSHVLREIQQNAKQINDELNKQNKMIDAQSTVMEDLTGRLVKLNKDIKGFIEEQKPMTVITYVIACLLILAIVGFFVFEFGGV
jgi:SYP7 family syntaxin